MVYAGTSSNEHRKNLEVIDGFTKLGKPDVTAIPAQGIGMLA